MPSGVSSAYSSSPLSRRRRASSSLGRMTPAELPMVVFLSFMGASDRLVLFRSVIRCPGCGQAPGMGRTGSRQLARSNTRGSPTHPRTMLTTIVTALMPANAPAVDDDHALVRASIGGDTAAFEALYRRHAGRVHGVIARLLGRHGQRAEDLTQEAFVRAWQALATYRFESAFGTWLYRLAANTALMEMRQHRAAPAFDDDEAHFERLGHPDSAGHTHDLGVDLERAVEIGRAHD